MAEGGGSGASAGRALDRPDWERDGLDWPHRAASRFVVAAGLRWHVQESGDPGAPAALLLHGIGAASHSWRGLAPLLARSHRVIAPDLPGHGFTDPLPAGPLTLPGIAKALAALLEAIGVAPAIGIGHATGAAVVLRMSLDHAIAPALLVAINGALAPAPGEGGRWLAPLTRPLLLNRLTPRLIAGAAASGLGQRLIDRAGARLDPAGRDLYKRLLARPGHVAGALAMMADWDLAALGRDLPGLDRRILLLAGARDRLVLPDAARALAETLRNAGVEILPGLGHLAHEEAPERVAAPILREARALGMSPPETAAR